MQKLTITLTAAVFVLASSAIVANAQTQSPGARGSMPKFRTQSRSRKPPVAVGAPHGTPLRTIPLLVRPLLVTRRRPFRTIKKQAAPSYFYRSI